MLQLCDEIDKHSQSNHHLPIIAPSLSRCSLAFLTEIFNYEPIWSAAHIMTSPLFFHSHLIVSAKSNYKHGRSFGNIALNCENFSRRWEKSGAPLKAKSIVTFSIKHSGIVSRQLSTFLSLRHAADKHLKQFFYFYRSARKRRQKTKMI